MSAICLCPVVLCVVLAVFVYGVLPRLLSQRSVLEHAEPEFSVEGVAHATAEDTVARDELERGNDGGSKVVASDIAEKLVVSAAGVGALSAVNDLANDLFKKHDAGSVENAEGPYMFLNNSSSGNSASVSKNESKSKGKKSAVVVAPAGAV